jgi:hypothetical protein
MNAIEPTDYAELSGSTVLVAYSKTEAALAALRAKHAGVVFDMTTTKGDKDARAARLELKTLRTSLEVKRKELKAPALSFGEKIDTEAERVKAEIVLLENFIDQQIKADEKRRADEKEEKERIEAARVQTLRDKITSIRACLQRCHGISSERIANGIEQVGKVDVSAEVFAELAGEALLAKSETLEAMKALHVTAIAQEAQAAQVETQRLENERIAAEQRTQSDALAAQQAAIDKAAAELKEGQEKLAAEQATAKPMSDREWSASPAGDREFPHHQVYGTPAPQDRDPGMQGLAFVQANDVKPAAIEVMAPVATPTTPPTLRLGQMADRLGFTLTAALLSEMKFEPSATDKAAKLYHEAEWPLICAALVKRINKASVLEVA